MSVHRAGMRILEESSMSIGFSHRVDRERVGSFRVVQDRSLFQTEVVQDGRTKSEFANECDLNVLMERYRKAGVVPVPMGEGVYMDTDIPDLPTAMQYMIEAENSFNSLPSDVRKEFDNDPVRFVEFATDPANIETLREWGLAAPAAVAPEPTLVRVVRDPDSVSDAPKSV